MVRYMVPQLSSGRQKKSINFFPGGASAPPDPPFPVGLQPPCWGEGGPDPHCQSACDLRDMLHRWIRHPRRLHLVRPVLQSPQHVLIHCSGLLPPRLAPAGPASRCRTRPPAFRSAGLCRGGPRRICNRSRRRCASCLCGWAVSGSTPPQDPLPQSGWRHSANGCCVVPGCSGHGWHRILANSAAPRILWSLSGVTCPRVRSSLDLVFLIS